MPMRATTVRFSEDLWQLLEAEAAAQGISAAQFVRDSAIMRLGILCGRRGDESATALEDLAARSLARRRPVEEGNGAAPGVRDPARLAALARTRLLDSSPEPAFDRLTHLATKLLNAPVALVSLVDEDRQFFKSCVGLGEPWASRRETPLSHSFCQHALASDEPLVIEDARNHPVVCDNLAIGDLDVVAYAGIPLRRPGGPALGTLCVIDRRPRSWTRDQIETLAALAFAVMAEIELGEARAGAAEQR